MTKNLNEAVPEGMVEIFTPYITVKGKRVYKKDGGMFHFFAPPRK
nr:MAG TPA: hypothetical protein [Caudoviricetes sp.]